MKLAVLIVIICLTLTQSQILDPQQINDFSIAINQNYGKCCHQHYIYGIASGTLIFFPALVNPFLTAQRTWLNIQRTYGRDIWVSAFRYNYTSWQAYSTLTPPPPASPPTSFFMIHQTPSYWLIPAPPIGWAFLNMCSVLSFLSTQMNCHDDKINFIWITLWNSTSCNNFSIISNFIHAYWNWQQCGCNGTLSVRRINVWNLLPLTAQQEAKKTQSSSSDSLTRQAAGRSFEEIAKQIGAQYSSVEPSSEDEFRRIVDESNSKY